MLQNYFKIAIRNLRKQKLFSGINIFGLSLAIACSLLLFLTAFRELSFDRFHENGDQIFRTYFVGQEDQGERKSPTMPIPLKAEVDEKLEDVKYSSRLAGSGASVEYDGKVHETGISFVDPEFLKMFSFPLLKGDRESALDDIGSILITEKQATQFFGEEDPLEKTIIANFEGVSKTFIIKGVLKNAPFQSSIRLSLITRFENRGTYQQDKENWDDHNHSLFVQLHPTSSLAQTEEKLISFTKDVFANDINQIKESGINPGTDGTYLRLRLQPIFDLHFQSYLSDNKNSSAYIYPIALLLMGVFILTIACINFVNLTMGSSINRSLEVGVRKVLGASKKQLIGQFWGEAILIIVISIVIALMAIQWFLPEYNTYFSGSNIKINNPIILVSMLIVLLFVTLVGGGYPAFVISKLQPASILKKENQSQGKGNLRNLLVVIQFAIAIVLISCTFIVQQQLDFLRNKPLGYNKEQVISIPVGQNIQGEKALNLFKQKLQNHSEILSITGSYGNFGIGKDGSSITSIMGFMHEGKEVRAHWFGVHYDYIKTLDLELVEGRPFDPDRTIDSVGNIIINEALAKQLSTESYIGKTIKRNPKMEVIGVVKDFHFKSLQHSIAPMCFVIDPEFGVNYIFAKVAPDHMPRTMALLEKTWKEITPESEFEASFLDENIDRQYKTEDTLSKIILFAAFLTIVLSCMGLFGIALLTIIHRTKEIGVRKVLGASVGNIVMMISKDFLKLVFVAGIIAIPLGWYAMNIWLQDFQYRIDLPWWAFAIAAILAMVIAFTTVSFHSVRAALSNPIKALRNE